jgi:hypothetical protein
MNNSRTLPLLAKFADLKRAGIVGSRSALHKLQTTQGFPRPHDCPGVGRVWAWKNVDEWFRARGIDLGLTPMSDGSGPKQ